MAGGSDTSLGGDRREFPSTLWSQFLNTPSPASNETLEMLASRYWKPVYSYIRVKWARTNDEAKDATQGFFLWVLESEFLAKVDRNRGRFRAILKIAVDHYIINQERYRRSAKRGGGRALVELDKGLEADAPAIELPDPLGRTPDQLMDDAWKQELLATAMGRIEREMKDEGRGDQFAVFNAYCNPDGTENAYKDLATQFEMSVEEVANAIRLVKKRCRETLIDLVAETVESRSDLDEELKWLFGEGGP